MRVTITSDAIPATLSGRELVGKNLTSAPGRSVIELQTQTGWKLAEIREKATEADSLGGFIIAFLTLHAAGYPIRWDDVLDELSIEAIVTELDEDEKRQAEEAQAEQEAAQEDPQRARTDSQPGDSAEPASAVRATPKGRPSSSSTSRGSKARSASA